MMKLLYIAQIRLPTEKAHGYQIMKTCEALSACGNVVSLWVTSRASSGLLLDPFEVYRIKKSFLIQRLSIVDAFARLPSILHSFGFYLMRWMFLIQVRRRYSEVRSMDAVYTRDVFVARMLVRLKHPSVYLELHALPSVKELQSLHGIAGIICVTSWMTEQVRLHLPRVLVSTVADAVDIDVFDSKATKSEARQTLGLDPSLFLVMYGGRFSTLGIGKGLRELDRAVQGLSMANSSLRLILVGGTTNEFEQIEQQKPGAQTVCIGNVSRDTLALYYRASDLLVMPFPNIHHYAVEMSPLKMFEYLASGTLILASDLPSVRDVLEETSAILYDPDQPLALEQGIVRAMALSAEQRGRMEYRSKQLAQKYTWDCRAQRITNFMHPSNVSDRIR